MGPQCGWYVAINNNKQKNVVRPGAESQVRSSTPETVLGTSCMHLTQVQSAYSVFLSVCRKRSQARATVIATIHFLRYYGESPQPMLDGTKHPAVAPCLPLYPLSSRCIQVADATVLNVQRDKKHQV